MEKIITSDELSRIAELSKLEIDSEKSKQLITDLENMIEFAESISFASVTDTQKETNRLFLITELRNDAPAASMSIEKALLEAPTHTDCYITVPTVIEE